MSGLALSQRTLAGALERRAQDNPYGLAVSHPSVQWTWTDLAVRVDEVATELRDRKPGERVYVDAGEVAAVIPKLIAAEAARVCLVPIAGSLDGAERARRISASEAFAGPAPGLLIFTSGTTGEARGVRLSYTALRASASMVIQATRLQAGGSWFSALPLNHVGGIGVVFRCVLAGATMCLRDRFDPLETAQLLGSGDLTHGSFVARMLARTLDSVAPRVPTSPALVTLMVGGGPTADRLLKRARLAGLPVRATYGMTEAASTLTLEREDGPFEPPSAGVPLPGVEIRLGDDEVIEVRSPALMAGYDPPHDQLVAGEWLRTNDVGRLLPDGRLVVLDRRSDLIVSGGENVSPVRVETVLNSDTEVVEAAVIGVQDSSWGQRVVAVVRFADGVGAEEERLTALAARVRPLLAPHERPKSWRVVATPLPRNGLGKLLRRRLQEALD